MWYICDKISDIIKTQRRTHMSLRVENEKDLDFSKMEVLLRRGLKASKTVPVIVVFIAVIAIFWGLATVFLFTNDFKPSFSVILFYALPVVFSPLFIITFVKFARNKKIALDNLYYDSKTKRFYVVTAKGEIKSVDVKEDIRVGNNMAGFDEAVVVYNGERINTGYTSTDLNATNRRIAEIRKN